jgi:hypothetical protein
LLEAVGKCSSRFERDEVLRNEAYLAVRRSDDLPSLKLPPSPRLRRDKSARHENEDDAADERFPTAS